MIWPNYSHIIVIISPVSTLNHQIRVLVLLKVHMQIHILCLSMSVTVLAVFSNNLMCSAFPYDALQCRGVIWSLSRSSASPLGTRFNNILKHCNVKCNKRRGCKCRSLHQIAYTSSTTRKWFDSILFKSPPPHPDKECQNYLNK